MSRLTVGAKFDPHVKCVKSQKRDKHFDCSVDLDDDFIRDENEKLFDLCMGMYPSGFYPPDQAYVFREQL